MGGGRSKKYEARRARRPAGAGARAYAPEWSDAAAAAVLGELHKRSSGPRKVSQYCDGWLPQADTDTAFLRDLKLSPADREVTAGILAVHAARARSCHDDTKLRAMVKAFLKPLRERKGARTTVEELEVTPAPEGPLSFHNWLSAAPEKDRLRDISSCPRILEGIASWPLGWLKKRGVVCYERAKAKKAKK